jgi:hypothetical protein
MLARTLITLAVAAAALGACATPQAAVTLTADIAERVDRMRGCWIAREGTGATFLRLLPPEVGASTIAGGVDRTGTTTVDRTAVLSFARDGTTAELTTKGSAPVYFLADAPDWAPRNKNWLVYRSTSEPVLFMLIEAPGETLRIMTTIGPGAGQPIAISPLYEANRDGCD